MFLKQSPFGYGGPVGYAQYIVKSIKLVSCCERGINMSLDYLVWSNIFDS